MFQYALGKHLSEKNNCELKIDIQGFKKYKLHNYALSAYNITENIATNEEVNGFIGIQRYRIIKFIFKRFLKTKSASENHILQKHFYFDPEILNLTDNKYLEGTWQSERYFNDIERIIKNDFTVKTPQIGKDLKLGQIIKSTNSVSIHVRRGDYISNPKTNKFHGTCTLDYYHKAINLITQKIDNLHFFLFSDDCEWVKQHLKIDFPLVIVDHNNPDKNYEDLRLMSQCKHHIIANSTFSWWGAWLSENPDKIVIAPQKWFAKEDLNQQTSDLIPDSWIRI